MTLTLEHVESLAPDDRVLAAGRKLARPEVWRHTGRHESVIWGECLGSAVYEVRADLADTSGTCSCPSRKLPCKHVIGLLTLEAQGALAAQTDMPSWVTDWLSRRRAREKSPAIPPRTRNPGAQTQQRADRRRQRILDGMDVLEAWMCDMVHNGIAGIELQPRSFWDQQSARLVDAQAPGLAGRVRRLAGIPASGDGWPERLLAEMGKIDLLLHAYRRLDQLDPLLQHDVRQLVGLRLSTEEVAEQGEHLIDEWSMVGQLVDGEDSLHTQRTWLVGLTTGRSALILQFAVGRQTAFPFVSSLNAVQRMELHFWPGRYPLRARIDRRLDVPYRLDERRPGHASIEDFLAATARALSRNPWLDRFLAILHDVVPVIEEGGAWSVRDRNGAGLPLVGRGYWRSLANSGGHPMDLYAEWDGFALRPMAIRVIEDIPTAGAGR